MTFYELPFFWVTGYEVSDYWRRRDVPVRIGDRVEHNLTMMQLWVFVRGKAEQVLVLYPTDGIWRIHPLPPAHLPWIAYGSSFFVGPIEMQGTAGRRDQGDRLRSGDQDLPPRLRRWRRGDVKLADLDEDHIVLDVAFDRAIFGSALRGPALDVCDRVQRRRGAHRVADAGRQELARGADHELPRRQGDQGLDGTPRALAPQYERAGHGVQRTSSGKATP